MKTQARVVVIGGGAVGVSTLYHLAQLGWSDVVLVERTELTAGSTWHAAGLLPLFNMSYSVGQIHKYSVNFYKTLEEETGQNVSFHVNGNLRLAQSQDRMDEFRKYCGTANTIGVPYELLTPSEVKELWPLAEVDDIVGAIYHPDDGHIAPADLTTALSIGARNRGAEIYRQTAVTGVTQKENGEWIVHTSKGDVTCEHIVCATGNYARQTGAMFGLDIPAIPVEHQYIVTEPHPALMERHKEGKPELPVLRPADEAYYFREERQGFLLGPYEKGAPARFVDGVPDSFGQDLFPGDLERLMPHVEAAMKRIPAFAEAGIKDIINGPISYTPDGNPLVGPAWGVKNLWLSEGHSFGITAAGGAGRFLAEWIVEGEPSIELIDVDPRRYGAYANKRYTKVKNEEAYEHVFVIHYPDEERPAARPAKMSPVHDRLDAAGAVWGQRYGWERPNWFAPEGVERKDVWSFRRTNYFEHVGNEARHMREKAGLIDLTSFSKFEISGPGAEAYLDRLVANTIPKKVGRMSLSHALTQAGGVRSEFTITKLAENRYYLISSGSAERFDWDFLYKNLPDDGSVRLDNVTNSRGVFVLAGPNARHILQQLTDSDLSTAAFPWLTGQTINVGLAGDVRALRVNFVGELGWELHHPIEYQRHIFDEIMRAGEAHELGLVGIRAMDVLRTEKSYRMWAKDLSREYSAFESGLDRFVRLNKGEFTGREALVRQQQEGIPQRFVTLEVFPEARNGRPIADPGGNEPLYSNGTMIGRATSGVYGHNLGKSIALGYVTPDFAEPGTELEIEILRDRFQARVVPESPWDPENERLRA
ncbi:FAD-dependent oxidoreductase [Fodinicurvata halophila]|uniref:FAD-dependent oxidoreductase n=1 Tax=Fodinicurvata halophila TaxID=1419723 RepID=A0ABV8UNC1_9PROT